MPVTRAERGPDICGIAGFYAPRPVASGRGSRPPSNRRGTEDRTGTARGRSGWNTVLGCASIADGSAAAARRRPSGSSGSPSSISAPTGDQPMVEPGRAALIFNGEIYNYVELREELRSRGLDIHLDGRQRGAAEGLAGVARGRLRAAQRDVGDRDLRRRAGRHRAEPRPVRREAAVLDGVARRRRIRLRGEAASAVSGRRDRLNLPRAAAYLRRAGRTSGRRRGSRASTSSSPGTILCGRRSAGADAALLGPLGRRRRRRAVARTPTTWQRRFAEAFGDVGPACGCGRTCRSGHRCPRASTARP